MQICCIHAKCTLYTARVLFTRQSTAKASDRANRKLPLFLRRRYFGKVRWRNGGSRPEKLVSRDFTSHPRAGAACRRHPAARTKTRSNECTPSSSSRPRSSRDSERRWDPRTGKPIELDRGRRGRKGGRKGREVEKERESGSEAAFATHGETFPEQSCSACNEQAEKQ